MGMSQRKVQGVWASKRFRGREPGRGPRGHGPAIGTMGALEKEGARPTSNR